MINASSWFHVLNMQNAFFIMSKPNTSSAICLVVLLLKCWQADIARNKAAIATKMVARYHNQSYSIFFWYQQAFYSNFKTCCLQIIQYWPTHIHSNYIWNWLWLSDISDIELLIDPKAFVNDPMNTIVRLGQG